MINHLKVASVISRSISELTTHHETGGSHIEEGEYGNTLFNNPDAEALIAQGLGEK